VADKVSCRLQTGNWDRFLDGMKDAAVGQGGMVALALVDVADDEALPSIRDKTPFKTGRARRAWKRGPVKLGRRPHLNIINREPYVRLLEYGTLGRRKKKLKEDTLSRRRQKVDVIDRRSKKKNRLKDLGAYSISRQKRFEKLWASKGGIKPMRMVARTIRELKAKNLVPLALQKRMKQSVVSLRRDVRRARGW